jgi:integrase
MASITKRGNSFQAEIRRKGCPSKSKCFGTLKEAKAWAKLQEALLEALDSPLRGIRERAMPTLNEALMRYQEQITPSKKSAAKEGSFIRYWCQSDIANLRLAQIGPSDIGRQRDLLLKAGKSAATVVRYLAVLSHLYSIARLDWGYQLLNPINGVRKPRVSNARTRRPSKAELEAILVHLGSHEMRIFILLLVETAMRRSELFKLRWDRVDLQGGFVQLWDTKNGDDRVVAISKQASNYFRSLDSSSGGRVFNFQHVDTPSKAFSRAVKRAREHYAVMTPKPSETFLVNLRLHDMRHEATSSLFEKGLTIPEVASITGHKTLSMLARYTHLNADSYRGKLDLSDDHSSRATFK